MGTRKGTRERITTKHPGSKRGVMIPAFKRGAQVYQKANPENTGTILAVDRQTGEFTVKYHQPTSDRRSTFSYPSYLAHMFIPGNPPRTGDE